MSPRQALSAAEEPETAPVRSPYTGGIGVDRALP